MAADEDGDDADVIRGGHGSDRADGGPGADVVFGDDVRLARTGGRVLDGSLGSSADGTGADYLDGGDGPDVLAGGGGSDLLLGGADDDGPSARGATPPRPAAPRPAPPTGCWPAPPPPG